MGHSRKYRIAFAGLARNCSTNLQKNVCKIINHRFYVENLHIFILENDSSDDTIDVIKSLNERAPSLVTYDTFKESMFDVTDVIGASKSRITRLANYRNRLLNMVLDHDIYDYIVMIDWDIDHLDFMKIINSIDDAPSDWGAIFANSKYVFSYKKFGKSFAEDFGLRDTFATVDYDKKLNSIKADEYSAPNMQLISYNYGCKLQKSRFVKCLSSFGGIGIYKVGAIKNCEYNTWCIGDKYLCEHIPFNSSISDKGYSNYIDRNLATYFTGMDYSNVVKYFIHWLSPKAYYFFKTKI